MTRPDRWVTRVATTDSAIADQISTATSVTVARNSFTIIRPAKSATVTRGESSPHSLVRIVFITRRNSDRGWQTVPISFTNLTLLPQVVVLCQLDSFVNVKSVYRDAFAMTVNLFSGIYKNIIQLDAKASSTNSTEDLVQYNTFKMYCCTLPINRTNVTYLIILLSFENESFFVS